MSPKSQKGSSRPRPQRMPSDNFRFIDQSSGTITKEQRQEIRSTVMMRIREEEEKAGIKRSGSRKPSPPTSQRSSTGQSQSRTSPKEREQFDDMLQELRDFQLPNTPSLLREDPFNEGMESDSNTVKTVAELMEFCFREYLPNMFPAFGSDDVENDKRQKNILSSKSDRLATFFGVLSIVAAHRTILSDDDLDLNPLTHDSDDRALMSKFSSMNHMKHHALSSINQTIQQMITLNQNLDEHVVEAVFLLIGAALSVGNLNEARMHFDYMKKSMEKAADFDHTSVSASPWIPLYDLAFAAAFRSRPLFDLPWDEDAVHGYLEDRVPPTDNHEFALIGKGFRAVLRNPSEEIRTIILQAEQIVLLCEYGRVTNRLSSSEHKMLYRKILQLQYDVVMYLYDDEEFSQNIPALDRVICLGILCLVSTTMIRVIPLSGQGRQTTLHHYAAIRHWLPTCSRSREELKLMLWAALIFRQCSADEEKSDFFDELLQGVIKSLKITSWKQTEQVLYEFLYMPSAQEVDLGRVLREALQG